MICNDCHSRATGITGIDRHTVAIAFERCEVCGEPRNCFECNCPGNWGFMKEESMTNELDMPLPKLLTELRDGTAKPAPNAGQQRQERIAKLQMDIAACQDVIADIDRYLLHLAEQPDPCVHRHVPKMVRGYLKDLRRLAKSNMQAFQTELSLKRTAQ